MVVRKVGDLVTGVQFPAARHFDSRYSLNTGTSVNKTLL